MTPDHCVFGDEMRACIIIIISTILAFFPAHGALVQFSETDEDCARLRYYTTSDPEGIFLLWAVKGLVVYFYI